MGDAEPFLTKWKKEASLEKYLSDTYLSDVTSEGTSFTVVLSSFTLALISLKVKLSLASCALYKY